MTIDIFKEAFQSYLQGEKKELHDQAMQFRQELREDEAKFALIEANIVDVFDQMFAVSYKKNAAQSAWKDGLKETYLGFFDKIPNNWKINLEECKAHGLEEEVFIETIKLNRADAIKEAFLTMLAERG